MALLKLSQIYLNLDSVTLIRDVSVRDGSGAILQGMFRVEFIGGGAVEVASDAETLRTWVNGNLAALPATGP